LIIGAASIAAPPWTTACAQELGTAVQGEWNGVLAAGSEHLRLRLVIEGDQATLFSLDQGGAPIPASHVRFSGETVRLTFPSIRASYEGRLQQERLVGVFTQGAPIPLEFVRGEANASRPPLTQESLATLRANVDAPALAAAASHRDGRTLRSRTACARFDAARR
jgi:hypothetical protein